MLLLKHQCICYDNFLRTDVLFEAAKDYKYLLNRGYNAITSLNLVSNHYKLSKEERLALYRSIHSNSIASSILRKTVEPQNLSSDLLIIDGFNVLITLTAALRCKQLIRGDDGFVRDILGVFGRVKYNRILFRAVYYLVYSLFSLNIERIVVVLDKNVKWSKLFSDILYKVLLTYVPYPSIFLAHKSDKKILSLNGIISSSDIVVLMHARKVFDIAGYIISRFMNYDNIIDFNKVTATCNKYLKPVS